MDELLISAGLEKGVPFDGTWGPEVTGGSDMGWRARLTPFESLRVAAWSAVLWSAWNCKSGG